MFLLILPRGSAFADKLLNAEHTELVSETGHNTVVNHVPNTPMKGNVNALLKTQKGILDLLAKNI